MQIRKQKAKQLQTNKRKNTSKLKHCKQTKIQTNKKQIQTNAIIQTNKQTNKQTKKKNKRTNTNEQMQTNKKQKQL